MMSLDKCNIMEKWDEFAALMSAAFQEPRAAQVGVQQLKGRANEIAGGMQDLAGFKTKDFIKFRLEREENWVENLAGDTGRPSPLHYKLLK